VKITEGPVCVEASILACVPPAGEGKRGHRTYNGLNLTVRRYGVVVGTYPTIAALAASWPVLAARIAGKVKVSHEQR